MQDPGIWSFLQPKILGYKPSFNQGSWGTRLPSIKDPGVWSFLRPRILGVWSFLQPKIWGTKLSSTKDPGIWSFLRPKIWGMKLSSTKDPGVRSFLWPKILGYEAFFDQRSWAMKLSSTKDPGGMKLTSTKDPGGMKLTLTLFPSFYTRAERKCTNKQWTMSPRKKGGLDIHDIVGVTLSKRCTLARSSCQLWTSAVWVVGTLALSSCQLWTSAIIAVETFAEFKPVVELWLKTCHGSLSTHTHPSLASPFPSLPQFPSSVCVDSNSGTGWRTKALVVPRLASFFFFKQRNWDD